MNEQGIYWHILKHPTLQGQRIIHGEKHKYNRNYLHHFGQSFSRGEDIINGRSLCRKKKTETVLLPYIVSLLLSFPLFLSRSSALTARSPSREVILVAICAKGERKSRDDRISVLVEALFLLSLHRSSRHSTRQPPTTMALLRSPVMCERGFSSSFRGYGERDRILCTPSIALESKIGRKKDPDTVSMAAYDEIEGDRGYDLLLVRFEIPYPNAPNSSLFFLFSRCFSPLSTSSPRPPSVAGFLSEMSGQIMTKEPVFLAHIHR